MTQSFPLIISPGSCELPPIRRNSNEKPFKLIFNKPLLSSISLMTSRPVLDFMDFKQWQGLSPKAIKTSLNEKISVTRLLIHHCNAMHWKIYLITCKTLEMLYFTAQLCLVLFALPYNISTAHVQFLLYNCGLHSTSAV